MSSSIWLEHYNKKEWEGGGVDEARGSLVVLFQFIHSLDIEK